MTWLETKYSAVTALELNTLFSGSFFWLQVESYVETGGDTAQDDEADDDYEEDNSDIIMIEDDQPDVAPTSKWCSYWTMSLK